jgi:hypothetical protein
MDSSKEALQNNVWAGSTSGSTTPTPSNIKNNHFSSAPELDSREFHPDITDESSRLLPDTSLLRKRKLHSSLPFLHRKSGVYDEEIEEEQDDDLEGNGLRGFIQLFYYSVVW